MDAHRKADTGKEKRDGPLFRDEDHHKHGRAHPGPQQAEDAYFLPPRQVS